MTEIYTATSAVSETRRGLIAGAVASTLVIIGGHFIYPASAPVSDAVPDRLTCYLPYLALVGAPIIIAMSKLALHRMASDDAIEGSEDGADPTTRHLRGFLDTTTPMTILALMVHFALLATLPYGWLNIAPLLAIWFALARLTALFGTKPTRALQSFALSATLVPMIAGAIAVPILLISRAFT